MENPKDALLGMMSQAREDRALPWWSEGEMVGALAALMELWRSETVEP